MENITFRRFQEEDAEQVHAVALEAWTHTYSEIFSSDFIHDFVTKNYSPAGLIELLPKVRSDKMFFDVAVSQQTAIGFCNIGDRGHGLLRPSFIGKGVGRQLLDRGERYVIGKKGQNYFCFVHRSNELGKNFYLRKGFVHVPQKDQGDEWYMRKTLRRKNWKASGVFSDLRGKLKGSKTLSEPTESEWDIT